MRKYKILDLYCCCGGASEGYKQSGFDVVGVDIEPQPKYKGTFIQSDAIHYLKTNWQFFDAIHASPPCQQYSISSKQFRLSGKTYPDLIEITRNALKETGLPYVIENVPGSPLINPIELCGSMFGIRTYRHRLFESSFKIVPPFHGKHIHKNTKMGRKPNPNEFIQYVGHFSGVKEVGKMVGLEWLGQYELAQSLPPHYTKFIGNQLIMFLEKK